MGYSTHRTGTGTNAEFGGEPITTSTERKCESHSRRRRREPYAWLGFGAIGLGVGAVLATGSGVAYADTGSAASSSSQSESAGSDSPSSGHDGRQAKARGSSAGKAARVRTSTTSPADGGQTTVERNAARPDLPVSAPDAPAASVPSNDAPAAATVLPAPVVTPAAVDTAPSPAALTRATRTGTVQSVLNALGLTPSNPLAPQINPLAGVFWSASRRSEGRSTARSTGASLTAAATAAAAAATTPSSVTYSVGSDWGSGHTAAMTVNAGSSALNGWTVEFDSPAQITNIWNAQITSHVGTHYVISNMAYNGKVAAGQSTSFGYQATPGAVASTPTNLKVNGVGSGNPPTTPPTVSISDVTVAEGNSGTSNANFTVNLSSASTTPVTVAYATSNGTATAGADYTATSGTVTFAAGVTSQTVAVKVTGDNTVEPNETFTVTLSNPTGATISKATATGTITNDDAAPVPTVSISDVTVAEGNSGTSNANFTVNLSSASTTPVTVAYATSNGTATAGADYTATSGTVTFAAGVTSQTVAVKVTGDNTVEPNETFTVTLSNPTGATISKATATGTITNDDVATPNPGNNSVTYVVTNEWNGGHNANMTVNAGQALTGWTVEFDSPAEIVNIWNAQITSHVGTHYVISNMPYNAQVASGQSTTFGYQANGTSAAATPTNLKVNGSAVTNPPATPSLSIADKSVAEGNTGTSTAGFTVTLSSASTTPVTVAYATSNGTATAGADYTNTSGTLTFAPGVTSQTVNVNIIGDATSEANETFTVTLSNPTGATISKATATGTITNDDAGNPPNTPGISIADASVTEPGTGGIAAGFLHTSGNQILDSQNKPVQLSSINWFGAESTNMVPHGLWTRSYKDMIDQMAAQGFNTIRLPYSSAMLHSTSLPSGIDYYQNPDLQGLTPIQVMDKIIDYAGQKGMRVVLDHHRSTAGAGTSENGLWYNSQYTEDAWVADWQTLATRYKNNPTVVGFDLHNEPYNGTWGGGGANDWARAAERAGNAVLAVNPNLLIMVEGIGTYKGDSYWWGGQLQGVKDRPIVLNVPNRVVYSPHDYPNSVWQQPWFQGDNFGAALPAKFRSEWGYIYEQNIAPIWIGEFGTKLVDPKDAVWFEAITSYLSGDFDNNGTIDIPAGTEDMSWAYWSWNPNSGDTGGILADDWRTINQNKLVYLKPIMYSGGNGTSVATFTVTLASPATQTVTVQYMTSNGTATSGSDYSASVGTLTFLPGETLKTISVVVNYDAATEGNETFNILLSNPVGATLTDATGVGTIIDRASA